MKIGIQLSTAGGIQKRLTHAPGESCKGFDFIEGETRGLRSRSSRGSAEMYDSIRQHVQLDLDMTRDDGKEITRSPLLLLLLLLFTFPSSLTRFGLHPRIIIKYRRSLPMRTGSGA